MSAVRVLEQARALGIALSASGGKLRYEAPAGRLTPELRAALAANKAAIRDMLEAERLAALAEPAPSVTAPADDPTRTCAGCGNVSKFGNCKEPVRAGLSVHFELIAAPEGYAPSCSAYKPKVARAVAADPAETAGHWLIVQLAQRIEHWYSPAVTRAELEARFPGAALIALPEASGTDRPPTAEETAELTRLIAAVARQEGFSAAEQTEALDIALRDPENALRYFWALLGRGGRT
jgi:hypothetical protein